MMSTQGILTPPVLTACALIYRTANGVNECLMTRRSFSSSFLPGCYELPGGHIEPHESELDGLRREIKEELNLEIVVEGFFDSFTYEHRGKTVLENIYLAQPSSSLDAIQIQEDEVASYLWVSATNFDQIVTVNKNPDDPEIAIVKRFLTRQVAR